MQGKIIKGIAGFYYVDVAESGIYECKAKGIFRKEKKKPLVGDNVEIEVLDEKEKTGNLIQILPRKNELIRPAAANVDQALVIFAVRQPDPNYQLLDRFLITMEQQEIPSIICFNKKDLAEQEELERLVPKTDAVTQAVTLDELSLVGDVLMKVDGADKDEGRASTAARTLFAIRNTDMFELFVAQVGNEDAVNGLLEKYLDENGRPLNKERNRQKKGIDWRTLI